MNNVEVFMKQLVTTRKRKVEILEKHNEERRLEISILTGYSKGKRNRMKKRSTYLILRECMTEQR